MKTTDLDLLKQSYTPEMQAAARIAAALPVEPWVNNETRESEPESPLVEPRPKRDL